MEMNDNVFKQKIIVKVHKLSCERKQVEQQQKKKHNVNESIFIRKKKKRTCQCLRGARVFNHM